MVGPAPSPTVNTAGYVTTWSAIAGKGAEALEEALGFAPASLSAGFAVYTLLEPVRAEEFEWKDRTAYSNGWHYDASIAEYVQRRDELRAHFGRRTGWDEVASDEQLTLFMDRQLRRLNVRVGSERIVKLRPLMAVSHYPDSPLRRVPQWRLTKPKHFVLAT